MSLLLLFGGSGGSAPFDPAPFAGDFAESDPQQLRPLTQTWHSPDNQEARSTGLPPIGVAVSGAATYTVPLHATVTWTDPTVTGTSPLASVAIYRGFSAFGLFGSVGTVLVGSVGAGVQTIDDYYGDLNDYDPLRPSFRYFAIATNTEGLASDPYILTGTYATHGDELGVAQTLYDAQPFVSNAQRWFQPDDVEPPIFPIIPVAPFDPALVPAYGNGDETQQLRPFGHAIQPTWETGGEKLPATPPERFGPGIARTWTPFHLLQTWVDPAGGSSALASVSLYRSIPNPSSPFETAVLVGTVAAGVQSIDDYFGDLADYGADTSLNFTYWFFATNVEGLTGPIRAFSGTHSPGSVGDAGVFWNGTSMDAPFPDQTQRWFAPDLPQDGFVPIVGAAFDPSPFADTFGSDGGQRPLPDLTRRSPDDVEAPIYPSLPVVTTASVPEQAALWPEQPGQERGNGQRWFAPDLPAEGLVPPSQPTTATVAQQAALWAEQPNGQPWAAWTDSDVLVGVSTADTAGHGCLYDELTALAPGWWARLGETTGTSLRDEMGGSAGTTGNSPTLGVAAGLVNDTTTAISFDSTLSQYATFPHGAGLATGDVFSIFFRFRRGAVLGSLEIVFDKGSTAGNSFMVLFGSDNKLRLADSSLGNYIVRTNVAITDALWHTGAFTKNGGTTKAFLDGVNRSESGTPATLATSSDVLTIAGADTLASFASVTVGDSAVFPGVVLTDSQVAVLHAAVLCDATPAEYVAPINDVQSFVSNGQRWFAPEPADLGDTPRASTVIPAIDYGADYTPRSTAQQWFAPEPMGDGFVPLASAPPARVDGEALASDPQQWRSTVQQWFAPELPDGPPGTAFPTTATVDQQAASWAEQPYPLRGNAQAWYDPSVEPVDGPLLSALFTGGSPGALPRILIDAETGDVFLYLGGILIVKAT